MYDPSEALFQLGLYDYVWGNPALLQAYNSNVQAEKARAQQREYDNYWKQIEAAKAERDWQYNKEKLQLEKDKIEAEKARTAEAKIAQLLKQRAEAKNTIEERAIDTEINSMLNVYPQFKNQVAEMISAQNDDRQYAKDLNKFRSQVKRNFNTDAEIDNEIQRVLAEDWIREPDRSSMVDELRGKKSTAQMGREASQSAVAGHTGKKTGEALTVNDILVKSTTTGYYPTTADKATMKAAGYVWDKIKRQYIGI
jgi:hypothetical protein